MSAKRTSTKTKSFYTITLSSEKEDSSFFQEYNILLKTIEAVNSFNSLYRAGRTGAKGGPSTHAQQDLYRAMLIFACAGLDVLVKQLIKAKLPKLIIADKQAENKFKEYVKRGLKKDDKELLNAVALALIDKNPRDIFLNDYIESMTGDSLQSVDELCRVSDASGLLTKKIFTPERTNALRDAFKVRNQIIHEMDINIVGENIKTQGYRTRRQRVLQQMEKHTKIILDLAQELFSAFKDRFATFQIDTEKKVSKTLRNLI